MSTFEKTVTGFLVLCLVLLTKPSASCRWHNPSGNKNRTYLLTPCPVAEIFPLFIQKRTKQAILNNSKGFQKKGKNDVFTDNAAVTKRVYAGRGGVFFLWRRGEERMGGTYIHHGEMWKGWGFESSGTQICCRT